MSGETLGYDPETAAGWRSELQTEQSSKSDYSFILDTNHPAHYGFWRGLDQGSAVYPDDAPLDISEALKILGHD